MALEVKSLFPVCSASKILATMAELHKHGPSGSGKPRQSRQSVTIISFEGSKLTYERYLQLTERR